MEKLYKDSNNQIYSYEEWVPEFGSYTEQEITNEDGSVTVEKIYPEFTVKEGLIAITQAEADEIRAKAQAEIEANAVKIVPQSLSRFQAKRILKSATITSPDGGENSLYNLTDEFMQVLDLSIAENDAMKDAWETAAYFDRASPTILFMQQMFELSDAQVDQLFIDGNKIVG